jgi:hypothetical protein
MSTRSKTIFAIVAAAIGWVSLILQLILVMENRIVSPSMAMLRFFTYFTILTNLLAAMLFTGIAFGRETSFFKKPGTITAVTGYMTVVAIIYNTILRGLVELHGLGQLPDELHHVILPMATLIFWLFFSPKAGLKWKSTFPWLLYPIAYIAWVMIMGAWTGFYPYPFTDAGKLGYPRALANGGMILAGFWLVFLVLIAVGRLSAPRSPKPRA